MIDIKELRSMVNGAQFESFANSAINSLLDRLEEAENERDNANSAAVGVALKAKMLEAELDILRAKVEEMKRQEPVVEVQWAASIPNSFLDFISTDGYLPKLGDKLYLAPGAQPAPSLPEGWKPIPEKHPTFDLVDLRLADGSVLCECVPQSDGDYWWNGPSGEVFIDPKYAPATHWRLAAAQEAKP